MDKGFSVKRIAKGTFKKAVYRQVGKGIPVMLVHGFPMDGNLWHYQAEELKKHFQLIIPDLPGSGNSPLVTPLSIEDMADFLNDILIQEGLKSCILIGHSMGGYIALAFAEKYPEKLQGLGLFHSTSFADTEEKKQGRLRSIELMKQYGPAVFLRQMMPNMVAEKFRKNNKTQLQALIKERAGSDVSTLEAYYQAMIQRPDRTKVLKQTKVPVLFVIGKEDSAAPVKDVLQQVALPSISEVHLFDEIAHLGMLEAPKISLAILSNFIRFCKTVSFQ